MIVIIACGIIGCMTTVATWAYRLGDSALDIVATLIAQPVVAAGALV